MQGFAGFVGFGARSPLKGRRPPCAGVAFAPQTSYIVTAAGIGRAMLPLRGIWLALVFLRHLWPAASGWSGPKGARVGRQV